MSLFAGSVEEANILDHAEAQCASHSVVKVGSVARLSLLRGDASTMASVGNGQIFEDFFEEAGSGEREDAEENPVLPTAGQLGAARDFVCGETSNSAALEFSPKLCPCAGGSEEDMASAGAEGHLEKCNSDKPNSSCGCEGPDHGFQLRPASRNDCIGILPSLEEEHGRRESQWGQQTGSRRSNGRKQNG